MKRNGICVIGSSNIDIYINSRKKLLNNTPVQGKVEIVFGGVGLNIALGLAELEVPLSFISVFSSTGINKMIQDYLLEKQIAINAGCFINDFDSFFCNINTPEENYQISDLKSMEILNVDFFRGKVQYLNSFRMVVFDLNISEEAIRFLTENLETRLVCETTSLLKCTRVQKYLDNISILKTNYREAYKLMNCSGEISINMLLDLLLDSGVKQIFLSDGERGLYYADKTIKLHSFITVPIENKSTVGAGDVEMAAILYALINKWNIKDMLIFAVKVSYFYIYYNKHKITAEIIKIARDHETYIDAIVQWWNPQVNKWLMEEK